MPLPFFILYYRINHDHHKDESNAEVKLQAQVFMILQNQKGQYNTIDGFKINNEIRSERSQMLICFKVKNIIPKIINDRSIQAPIISKVVITEGVALSMYFLLYTANMAAINAEEIPTQNPPIIPKGSP